MKKDIFAPYRLPYVGYALCVEATAAGRAFTPVRPAIDPKTMRRIFQRGLPVNFN